jgi:ribosomal protein S18 acetylase RimI-like enzyme
VRQEHRQHGYIFHVWVEPAFRRRGLARALVEKCIAYLEEIDCTTIVLHSSLAGERLYRALCFEPGSEMRLKLR